MLLVTAIPHIAKHLLSLECALTKGVLIMDPEMIFVVTRVVETGQGMADERVADFTSFDDAVAFWRECGGFSTYHGIHIAYPGWH